MIKKISGLYVGIGLKLILSLLIDRHIAVNLSPEFYGTFKYYVTLITILSTVTGLGLNVGIVKELSGSADSFQKQKKVLVFSVFFSFCASLVCYAICNNIFIQKAAGINFAQEFQVISLGVIAITLNKLFLAILSIKGNVRIKVIINDLLQPVILFGGVFFLDNLTLQNVVWVFICSQFFICFINVMVFYNSFNLIIKARGWKSASIRKFLLYCAPVFFTNVLIVFSTEIDKLVLSMLISKSSLGVYYAVAVLSNLLSLILGTLVFLYLPLASKNFNRKKFLRGSLVSSYISKWLMLFSFIPFWALFNFPKEIIVLFYTDEYIKGAEILPILALAQYVNLSAGFTGQNLIALGDSKGQLGIRLIGFAVSVIVAVLFGKYYGEIGVAIALVISLIFTNTLQVFRIKSKYKIQLYKKTNFIGLIFVLAMITCLTIINMYLDTLNSALLFGFNVVLFGVGLFFFLRNKQEKKAVKIIQQLL